MSNGCGPSWLPVPVTSALFDFFHEASCNKHDDGYAEGGDRKRRKVCDDKFYDAMKRDADRHAGGKRVAMKAQARLYYGLVRTFGWLHFNYKG
jgi:hypothetical protein